MIERHWINLKILVFSNAHQICHGNPDTVWHYHSGATSLHAKFDNETENTKKNYGQLHEKVGEKILSPHVYAQVLWFIP